MSGCPGCRCEKETLDHVLKFPNKEAREAIKAALVAFRVDGKKKRIPQTIIEKIHYPLINYIQGREGAVVAPGSSALDVATSQHMTIGLELLSRGFLAKGWNDTPSTDTVVGGDGVTVEQPVQDPTWQR